MRKLNIAITMELRPDPTQSIWYNGGNQNCFFLYQLLKELPFVANVWLASAINGDDLSPGMFMDVAKDDVQRLSDIIGQTDVLIEMGSRIMQPHADIVRARNGKLVAYKYGNDYVLSVESCSLKAHGDWIPQEQNVAFDEVWTNAQHENTCASFFKHLYKAPVHILPHLWSPHFVEEARKRNDETGRNWPYTKRRDKINIAMFEPNLNVVKSSIIPMYAAAQFAENHPDLVNAIYMLNTVKLAEHPLFRHLVLSTKAGQTGLASAEGRYPFVDYAAKYVDIVVAHQWENGLNYQYYEALYGGYPLVHNSPFLKDAGYYYPDFDIDAAAEAISLAAFKHDGNLPAYRAQAAIALDAIDPLAPAVQKQYADQLEGLFK